MGFLSDSDKEAVRERLDRGLEKPVRLTVFSEPAFGLVIPGRRACVSCSETEELMKEVAELSDKITLEVVNVREYPERAQKHRVVMTPTVAVLPEDSDESRISFMGIPAGYEFAALLETMISTSSTNGFGLADDSLEQLRSIEEEVDIKTFVTPT